MKIIFEKNLKKTQKPAPPVISQQPCHPLDHHASPSKDVFHGESHGNIEFTRALCGNFEGQVCKFCSLIKLTERSLLSTLCPTLYFSQSLSLSLSLSVTGFLWTFPTGRRCRGWRC